MLYISDFFTRHKEAVSNQLELLAQHKSGKIIAATRFMGQKALHKNERKDGIYIFPPLLYPIALALVLMSSRSPVHTFEEESFRWKRFFLNASGRPLYVSLYRRPEAHHLPYLRTYKNLKKIFVELPIHKEYLVSQGFSPEVIEITPTPSKVVRKKSTKNFNQNNINIVFASWNNSENNALHDRGVIYLLDLLVKNPEYSLTIPLRDSKTAEFWEIARAKGVTERVKLLIINKPEDLEALFDESDFVSFVAQDRIAKDVPNSLIDGLSYGKPVIISDVLDFWTIVEKQAIGYTIKSGTKPRRLEVTSEEYAAMSRRAYAYSKRHMPTIYQSTGTNYEETK
jgi:hypothetical protein